MWWSIGLLSVLSLSENYILLIGAFLNTCLFLFVSIPLAEKRQSRKEGFIEYKNETRMLLPIKKFKKNNLS
jgi:steroid 5-alpha reductase family enzyme